MAHPRRGLGEFEKLQGMPTDTIGAPLWVSSDRKRYSECQKETSWLDIVSSALGPVHSRRDPRHAKARQHRKPTRHRRPEMLPVQSRHRQFAKP